MAGRWVEFPMERQGTAGVEAGAGPPQRSGAQVDRLQASMPQEHRDPSRYDAITLMRVVLVRGSDRPLLSHQSWELEAHTLETIRSNAGSPGSDLLSRSGTKRSGVRKTALLKRLHMPPPGSPPGLGWNRLHANVSANGMDALPFLAAI